MKKKQLTTKRLVIDAMLAAMVAVLGAVAVTTNAFKVTFESFPIILGGLMFGPVDGLLIGGIGTLIYQLLEYGISATTALWILPYCISGLILGLFGKKYNFRNTKKQILIIVVITEFIITILNTGVMYVDARLYNYYFPGFITGSLALRIGICIVKSIVFGIVTPKITTAVKKAIK